MIYLFVCFLYLFFNKNKGSISNSLYFILFLSSIGAFLVGRQHSFDIQTVLFTLYNAILLGILFNSYSGYSSLRSAEYGSVSIKRLQYLEIVTGGIGFIVLLVNIYIFYKVFGLLMGGDINVQSHKNEGGAEEMFNSLVPHPLMTFSRLFSPLARLFLTLHFFYLVQGKAKKSIIFFILSLTGLLSGLMALSRSSSVQFALVYIIIFLFIRPLINRKTLRTIYLFGGIFAFAFGFVFYTISDSRFSKYYNKSSKNTAIINEVDNPLLFSTIDYFSSWQENAPIVMSRYQFGHCYWGLFNSCGLAVQIEKEIYGAQKVNEKWEKEQIKALGEKKGAFHGLIARLIFDFGFLGTIVFILVYAYFVKKNRPRQGILTFKTLLFLPVLLPASAVFFAGNEFSSLGLDISIIYNIFISKYLSTKQPINNCNKENAQLEATYITTAI